TPGLVFGTDLGRRYQNVTNLGLFGQTGGVAAHIRQFDQVVAVGAAYRFADLTNAHAGDDICKQGWQLLSLAPAKLAAADLESARRVRHGSALGFHTHLYKISTAIDALIQFAGKGFLGAT